MKELIVFGRASQKQIKVIPLSESDLSTNLMEILLDNGIPVASSCNGEGACLKCLVTANGEKIVSCQTEVIDIIKDHSSVTVLIAYL